MGIRQSETSAELARTEDIPTKIELGEFSIDEYRPIKVIVIGAGFSGILAGIRFPHKVPGVDLAIYEKSAGIGGTWYNNRYPGVACDIPAHCYQFSFENKRDWSSIYAPGHEIQQHLQEVVDKYKLMRYIKLKHEVVHAQWDETACKWHVRVRRPKGDSEGEFEEFEDVGDVLVTAFGVVSRWHWPDIPGMKDFKGELYHTAQFEPEGGWAKVSETWKNKRVGVVGSGSSAIQTVAAVHPKVAHLTNYVRGQTWISIPFAAGDAFAELLGRKEAASEDELVFTPQEIERFKTDPEYYWNFRRTLEGHMNSMHGYTQRGSKLSVELETTFRKKMQVQLAKKPWIAEKLIPTFPVSCRRLTPGPGYLDALCADNTDFVTSPIKRFTESGVETEDGQQQQLDIILCATGYDTSWQLPFKIIGRNGVDINEKWKPYPTSYLSMCVDEFPNMFMALGPNSVIGAGTLLPILEVSVGYAVQAVAKMQRERLKTMEVKPDAVREFDQIIEGYFPKTVYSDKCRSWYKLGKDEGRIVGLWPGSNVHALRALQNPRWEDYDYLRLDDVQNRLYWLGDGQTYNEKMMTGDRAWYLSEEYIDRPPVPSD
ncbi:flavin-binding monooxygenase [Lentinus tigrinus ALCF2SS1-7]|uniref:Flavin-binding monooxygenase n=1 Tax=Lentinus tigrinus ALCF2SS1-6 TaxID=1328759 RepID=A0A5C2S3H4_9APHY|nr:flavin-binding monooxygenase [Lentinus tigrinus ALCF2SS1-6]RPD72289.1 flavin-binding monooxygenase [Lentinus tigrinus ALCF2SS1-7]